MGVRRPPWIQRRFLCSRISRKSYIFYQTQKWVVKQVTKSNFSESIEDIKNQIFNSDFIAISLKKTGSYSAPWHRVLPIDTAETGYLKAKYAAERFQVLQFAVCPFSIRASKLIAHPYNFHLFPRDELKLGMPSYGFLCQSSYLTSMSQEGFDFNACIQEGISYLSRAQESVAKELIGNPVASKLVQSSSPHSVADAVFVGRIKSRVKHWLNACKESNTRSDDALIRSLTKLILGSEEYSSRPCLRIEVCSERQVQLALEMLMEFSDDVVPLLIPAKGGGTQVVQVVLTSSKEDRDLFEKEIQNKEEGQNKRVRGFREVIDLISTSQKPVVAHNSLNDFTFIHSKFLAPLPPLMDEFRISLRLVFPHVIDINHLMDEISPLKKVTNVPAANSYLKRHFFSPVDMEIPHQAETDEGKIHGHNVVRISHLFSKMCSILKITPETLEADSYHLSSALEGYTNIFTPNSSSSEDTIQDDVRVWTNNPRKVSTENLVFLWGFAGGMSARTLKSQLCTYHEVFSEDFDARLVDKSCAIIVFWNPGSSVNFLEAMESGGICCDSLSNLISRGLRAAGYETYKRVCSLGLWETHLADSLDKALADLDSHLEEPLKESAEIYWKSDLINLDDL